MMDSMAFSHVNTMFAGGLMVHYGMSHLHFHDNPRKLREQMEPMNWVKGALVRSGFMGMIPDLIDVPLEATLGETFFSPTNEAMLLSIPMWDMAKNVSAAAGVGRDMLLGKHTGGKEKYVFRRALPGTNHILYRILAEAAFPDDWPL